MYPLCKNFPKCLVPVANKPILAYQLELLEMHAFTGSETPLFEEVIIVTTKHHSKIESWLGKNYKGKVRPNIVTVHEEDLDSAQALLKVRHLIYVMYCSTANRGTSF